MSYYMGDFYMSKGGWRGDPFSLGSLWGIVKKAAGFIPGVGPIISALPGGARTASPVMSASEAVIRGAGERIGGAIIKRPVLTGAAAAGALGGAGLLGAGVEHMMGASTTMAPRGYHLCKSMRPGVKHPHPCKTGPFVRNRRMNVCNPRALRRAIRRTHGFAKLAMKAIHITHPKKKGRFGGFRKRRKA